MDLDQINQSALSNYNDSANDFDDETFDNFKGKSKQTATVRKASFDLVITNASTEALTIELFNELNSFTERLRPELVNSATVKMIPHLSLQGLALSGAGIVGFDKDGSLLLTGAAAAIALTVKCPQLSYKSLLKSSVRNPFLIKAIRMTVQNEGQIDNEIVHFTKSFLGSASRNTISPRTSFRPDQFQNKIIDIPMDFQIDGNKGLEYTVNPGETVKWNVVIERN